jgi:predicted nucleic acid-binding protein
MNLLVDASWLIQYERELVTRRFGPALQLMEAAGAGRAFINPIAYCEFLSKGETPKRRLIADSFLKLPGIDFHLARAAANLRSQRAKRGKTLSTPDALMAADAIRHSLRLVTADKDFSGIPGLDWSSYPRFKNAGSGL